MTAKLECPGKSNRPTFVRPFVTAREVDDDMAAADDEWFGTHVNTDVRTDSGKLLRIYLPSKRDNPTLH